MVREGRSAVKLAAHCNVYFTKSNVEITFPFGYGWFSGERDDGRGFSGRCIGRIPRAPARTADPEIRKTGCLSKAPSGKNGSRSGHYRQLPTSGSTGPPMAPQNSFVWTDLRSGSVVHCGPFLPRLSTQKILAIIMNEVRCIANQNGELIRHDLAGMGRHSAQHDAGRDDRGPAVGRGAAPRAPSRRG